MSAQDLYDALSQQSQVALGYLLGIVDARKGSASGGKLLYSPLQSDADEGAGDGVFRLLATGCRFF